MYKVFVYGSLKRGFGNHPVIADQKFIGEAMTTEPNWEMFSLGGFPGVVNGNKLVTGEVYEVDEIGLKRLDRLEGHPTFYRREVIKTDKGDAWMYILQPGYRLENKDRVTNNMHLETYEVENWERTG